MNKGLLSNEEIKELLGKYYPNLSSDGINILLDISVYKKFKSKEVILKKGRNDQKLFIILKGSARSYSIVNGEELNCHLRSEGFIMGDAVSFYPDKAAILETAAISNCDVIIFDIGELEKISYENKEIMKFYIEIMKEIIVVFSHRIRTFVTMNSSERYDDLMNWNPLYLKSTFDKHLASFLGMTPLTFHRVKNKKKN